MNPNFAFFLLVLVHASVDATVERNSTNGTIFVDDECSGTIECTEEDTPEITWALRYLKKLTKKDKKRNINLFQPKNESTDKSDGDKKGKKNYEDNEEKKTKKKKKANLFKEKIEPKQKVKEKTKDDKKNKKKNDKEEEKLTKKQKKELTSLLKPDEKLTKKEKKQKKLNKKEKKENKVNEGDIIDHRAIHIRNSCKTPLNIYRTCYDRALDPNNDLEEDELRLQTPFSAPFIDDDEWLVSDSMYLVLTELSSDPTDGDCSDVLRFEELALTYLKDNIGGEDTFSPLCVLIGNSAADETPTSGIRSSEKSVRTKSGEEIDVSTTAMRISVVFAFKKEFSKEVANSSPNLRRLVQTPRFLASCSNGGFGKCCSGSAMNSRGASRSAKCSGGCGSRDCKKKKPKKPNKSFGRELIGSRNLPDFFNVEFIDAVNSYTNYDPVETRAVVEAENVENVAVCAVNRYIQDTIRPRVELEGNRSFTCRTYDVEDCSENEDIIPETDETRSFCEAKEDGDYSSYIPTVAPSLSPTLSPTVGPSFSPTFTPNTKPSNRPSDVPTRFPSRIPSKHPTHSSSRSPSIRPTTSQPTRRPTNQPSVTPGTPSRRPTARPTPIPTESPTRNPSRQPSSRPAATTTVHPTTKSPTPLPTPEPSVPPSMHPATLVPTSKPTVVPTTSPTPCMIAVEYVSNLFEYGWQGIYCDLYNMVNQCASHVVAVSGDVAVSTRNNNDNKLRLFSKVNDTFVMDTEYSIAYWPHVVEIFGRFVLVGSPWEAAAVVRVYEKNYNDGSWNHSAVIIPEGYNDTAYFGGSINIYGKTMVVGSYNEFYVFKYLQSNWVQDSIIVPNGTVFSPVASIWEDLIAVSGYCHSDAYDCAGEVSVYNFDSSKDHWVLKSSITNDDCPGWFGGSGLIYTSDGGLLIGCYIGNNINASVYYYTKESEADRYNLRQRLSLSYSGDTNPGRFFGKYTKMSLDGNVLVVAQGVSEISSTVFIFQFVNNVWTEMRRINRGFPNFYLGSHTSISKYANNSYDILVSSSNNAYHYRYSQCEYSGD